MRDIPIYRLLIDEEETGVEYVALVDKPAIERNWFAFSESKSFHFKTISEEKRIITGALMVANMPIYRNDPSMGEYYAVFDSSTIEKIVQRFFKNGFASNVNVMHNAELQVGGMYMFESFIINRERGINPPNGFEGLTDGSWVGSYKVDNDMIWNDFIKTGELKGFSIEGLFKHEHYVDTDQKTLDAINDIINSK
jgi:hypothetical protein